MLEKLGIDVGALVAAGALLIGVTAVCLFWMAVVKKLLKKKGG